MESADSLLFYPLSKTSVFRHTQKNLLTFLRVTLGFWN